MKRHAADESIEERSAKRRALEQRLAQTTREHEVSKKDCMAALDEYCVIHDNYKKALKEEDEAYIKAAEATKPRMKAVVERGTKTLALREDAVLQLGRLLMPERFW